MPVKLLLADDHGLVREGFRALLEREGYQIVGEASDGREAVCLAGQLKPDVAIMDLSMPLLNGIDATRQILRTSAGTKVIILTMYTEDQYVLEALRAGVAGYLLKTKAAKDLVQAIRQVSKGTVYLSPEVSKALVEAYRSDTKPSSPPLTPREREVLQLVAEGKTTKEVATILGISVKTADSHRTRIMRKLDIHETAGLVRYAIRSGIVRA
jgi:two-component system, NarL family, response regulator NreC